MSEAENGHPAASEPNLDTWAAYAKDRFDSADARINESRSWARQLVGAIGIVIGLEATLFARLALDTSSPLHLYVRGSCLALVFTSLAIQFFILRRVLRVGYRSDRLLGPENPKRLLEFVVGKDDAETRRLIGAYYANAYDRFHELAERLGKAVGDETGAFQRSLVPLLLGLALMAFGALWHPLGCDTQKSVDEAGKLTVSSPSSPVETAPTSAAASGNPQLPLVQSLPSTAPILATPTEGELMQRMRTDER